MRSAARPYPAPMSAAGTAASKLVSATLFITGQDDYLLLWLLVYLLDEKGKRNWLVLGKGVIKLGAMERGGRGPLLA